MTRRYFAPELSLSGGPVELSDTEAHHAMRVMRVQAGESIVLFDGKGHESEATITAVSRSVCLCNALPANIVDREPHRQLHLGIALPKPDRARELIERLTELGVKSVTPLTTERTQRPPSGSLLEKLRRGSVEACKQSGRNVLVQFNGPMLVSDFLASCDSKASRWIADQQGPAIGSVIDSASDHVMAAIGPEGGWTGQELEHAEKSGFKLVGFGKRILRVETAATFLAARLLD